MTPSSKTTTARAASRRALGASALIAAAALALPAAPAAAEPTSTVEIISTHNAECLAAIHDGVFLMDCVGEAEGSWELVPTGLWDPDADPAKRAYLIMHSGGCLSSADYLAIEECSGGPEQEWRIDNIGDTAAMLVDSMGRALSVIDFEGGVGVEVTEAEGAAHQAWFVHPLVAP